MSTSLLRAILREVTPPILVRALGRLYNVRRRVGGKRALHLQTHQKWAKRLPDAIPVMGEYWRRFRMLDFAIDHIRPEGTVVDVGCGVPSVLFLLPSGTRIGIDPLASEFIPLLPSELLAGVAMQDGCIEALPFDAESVDYIFASNMLDHVEDPAAGIAEMARVLKPGGYAHVAVEVWPPGKISMDPAHPYCFTIADVESLMGFDGQGASFDAVISTAYPRVGLNEYVQARAAHRAFERKPMGTELVCIGRKG